MVVAIALIEAVEPTRENNAFWDKVSATAGSEQVRNDDADQRPSAKTAMEAVPTALHVTKPLLEIVSVPTGVKLQVTVVVSSFCVPSE